MAGNYKNKEEAKEILSRFEEMLRREKAYFFDLDTYEYIINHFSELGKFKKAMAACEMAMEQYPFSLDLLQEKAQLLAKTQKYEEALELIDQTLNLQPN